MADNLNFSVSGFYQKHKEETLFVIFPPNFALPSNSESGLTVFTEGLIGNPGLNEENTGAEAVINYNPNNDHNFRIGFGFHQTDGETLERKNFGPLAQDFTEELRDGSLIDVTGTPYVFGPDVSRDVWYVTLQDEWKVAKDWELTAGIRYDDYSDFGSTVNPRFALVWQAKHNLTAKALYGKAFRAPSFGELFFTNNPISLGNPELDPEKINTFEVAFDYRPSFDWKILFNLFSYEADNLIVFSPVPEGNQASNAGAQDAIGAELEIHWAVTDNLDLKFGYALQNSENAETKEDIADAPQSTLDLTLNWQISEALHWHVDSIWISNRARLSSDIRSDISDYNWVNSNLTYSFSSKLNFSLSIRNLLNENAKEASNGQIPEDFPLEQRGYWLTTRYNF